MAIYPIATTGSPVLSIHILDSTSNLTGDTIFFNSLGFGNKIWIPLNIELPPGNNYKIVLGSASGYAALYRETGTGGYPYNGSTSDLVLTQNFPSATDYNYFYDWRYHTICKSQRVPVTATVNPAPAVNIGINGSDTIYRRDSIVFSAQSSSSYNWKWRTDTPLQDSTSPSITLFPDSSMQLILFGYASNKCENYDTIQITVVDLTGLSTTISPGQICSDQNSQLGVSGHISTLQYSWSGSPPPLNPGSAFSLVNPTAVSNPVTYTYSLTATDPQTDCIFNDTITLQVNPAATVNLGPDTLICEYTQILLDAGAGNANFTWTTGDSTRFVTVSYLPTTQYFGVNVQNQWGCTASDNIWITSAAAPVISLGNDLEICANHTILLNAGTGYASYLWFNGDTTQSTTLGPGAITGNYWVEVTNAAGCPNRDTIMVTVNPCTDITEYDANTRMNIYPNPNNGHFFLEIATAKETDAQLDIFNIQGQVLHTQNMRVRPDYKQELRLQDVPPGIYFVRVTESEFNTTKRVVVH